jgi:hypothetical protein
MTFPDATNTLALPDHADHIHIGYHPTYGPNTHLGAQTAALLKPTQWVHLIDHISQIPNPIVHTKPSKYAITNTGD